MTTRNAATDVKSSEKLAEKRRALGRGLESLLPGPRVVTDTSSQFSVPGSQKTSASSASSLSSSLSSSSSTESGVPGRVEQLQAVAGQTLDGAYTIELALDQIQQNPYQTRTEFEPNALAELAASIQVQGVLQPIVVRPRPILPGSLELGPRGQGKIGPGVMPPEGTVPEGEQRYVLILGERRFRASKMAGKTTIPAIVKRVSEQQAAEMTLVENLQRQDLECVDQAQAFSKLSTEFNLTQEEIGKRVGVSREQVSNYLRLLKLPPEVQMALRKKELTYSHARLLLALDDDIQITNVARVAIAKKMSVALLQEMVMDRHLPKNPAEAPKGGGARWVDPNVRAEQRSLEAILGLRVRIRDRKGKGKILIEYGTIEEFDRVVTMLKGH